MSTSPSGPSRWHLDIDHYVNPWLPPSFLPRFPHFISHFLGYRTHPATHSVGNVLIVFWASIGIFTSLAVIGAVSKHIPSFQENHAPLIVGSLGAAAVLDFYAIESPLAQPRNALLGQVVCAVIGISVGKLFALSPHFEDIRWLGASVSCAVATVAMGLTGTVHPPAGATALMAVLDADLSRLGWFLLAPVILGCSMMLAVALLVNNIQRRFPYYWWSPEETGSYWRHRRHGHGHNGHGKRKAEHSTASTVQGSHSTFERKDLQNGGESSLSGDVEAEGEAETPTVPMAEFVEEHKLVVTRGHVQIPAHMYLTPDEKLMLETLAQRL